MTIQEYFGDWSGIIDLQEADKIAKKLSKSPNTICPSFKDIFRAFKLCSFYSLRCIIIGFDPYPTLKPASNGLSIRLPVATGLAFANSPDTPEDSLSPSLAVLRESVIDYTIPHRTIIFDPSLEKWEAQGVLMLNSALSCEVGKTGSHTLLWRPFISSFLTNLSKCSTGIVYVLMGSQAQSFESCINHMFNHVIKVRHPSYYARTKTLMPSDIWKQVNQILISQNGYGIQWYQEN